jgi:hypothetical protein
LVLTASIAIVLLALGRHDYPNLHTVLDTGACLLAGILALLLWDIGQRARMPLTKWLAGCFTVTFLAELVHVAVTLDWFGSLGGIVEAQLTLRPTTWPIAAYVLAAARWHSCWRCWSSGGCCLPCSLCCRVTPSPRCSALHVLR